MLEVFFRQIFSKEHNIRFDGPGAECADGNTAVHYSLLRGKHKSRLCTVHGMMQTQNCPFLSVYLGFLCRIRSIAEVTGSGGKTPMSFHKFVIRDTANYRQTVKETVHIQIMWLMTRTLQISNDDLITAMRPDIAGEHIFTFPLCVIFSLMESIKII